MAAMNEAMVERMARMLFAQSTEARSGFTWPINGDWGRARDMERAETALAFVLGNATPDAYLALDLWSALGLDSRDFDAYYERNGWAETWAVLLDRVRTLGGVGHCLAPVDGEYCGLRPHTVGPHMGASDLGSGEPLPVPEPDDSEEADRG